MFDIGLLHYMLFAAFLFLMGLLGVLIQRRNLLVLLLCVELMLLAANVSFVSLGRHFGDISSHMIVLVVLAVAAAESAIGLALFVVCFHNTKSLSLTNPMLKG